MIDRRSFTALLAGAFATPRTAWSQMTTSKAVFYASVGPALTLYHVDVDTAGFDPAEHDDAARQYPVRMAASIRLASLCGVEQWWPRVDRRFGRHALFERAAHRPRQWRATGARPIGRIAVATHPRIA
jgi:hypothetical protein